MEDFLLVSNIVLWVIVLIQFGVIFMLSRLVAGFLNRFRLNTATGQVIKNILRVGDKAPLFREFDQAGRLVKLAEHEGNSTLLLFTKDSCVICQGLMIQLAEIRQSNPHLRVIVVAPRRSQDSDQSKQVDESMHMVRSDELMSTYFIDQVPVAMLINTDGYIVMHEAVSDTSQLVMLLDSVFRKVG